MKTAGSSVEFALALSCGPGDLVTGGMSGEEQDAGFLQQNNVYYDEIEKKTMTRFHTHTTPELLKKRIIPELYSRYEKYSWITMTRNPWDTVVSFYWWSMKNEVDNKEFIIKEYDSRKDAIKKFTSFMFNYELFIDNLLPNVGPNGGILKDEIYPWKYAGKYNSQHALSKMNYYIRYENIEQDFEHVVDTLGLYNVELPHFKSTQKKLKKHYSYYYTTETRKIVAEGFKDYIEKFDYKFENKITKLSRRDRAKRRKDKKR
jgi:hypothetical protein